MGRVSILMRGDKTDTPAWQTTCAHSFPLGPRNTLRGTRGTAIGEEVSTDRLGYLMHVAFVVITSRTWYRGLTATRYSAAVASLLGLGISWP